MSRLTDRIVLITGCSTGIGRVTTDMLLDRGHTVYATARRPESIQQLTDELSHFGDRARIRRLDVNDSESAQAVVNEIRDEWGRIDALVNNAAYGQSGAVEELTPDEIRKQFETNIVGLLELTQRVLAAMRQSGSGRIINVSSVVAHVSLPMTGAYNASKAALNALSNSMRMELRGTGIHVILIEPGAIRSAFRENSVATVTEKAADPNSPYHKHYEAWNRKWRHQLGQKGAPPEKVARAITRAVECTKPKTRYRVTASAKLAPIAQALLSDRLIDRIILRRFGLK